MIESAIILNAGRGKRMGELTNFRPKCLLMVKNQTILEMQIRALISVGVTKIVMVVGYQAELLKETCNQLFPKIKFVFVQNDRYVETNTLYSLHLAVKKVKVSTYYLNGDVVFDPQVLRLLSKSNPKKPVLAVQIKKNDLEEIKVKLDNSGDVIALSKKLPLKESVGEFTGIAVYPQSYLPILKKSLSACVSKGFENEYFEFAIEYSIAKYQQKVTPVFIGDYKFVEVDFNDDYTLAKTIFG